jgi:hypothetical protein
MFAIVEAECAEALLALPPRTGSLVPIRMLGIIYTNT